MCFFHTDVGKINPINLINLCLDYLHFFCVEIFTKCTHAYPMPYVMFVFEDISLCKNLSLICVPVNIGVYQHFSSMHS